MAWTIKGESGVTVTTVAGVTYGLNATTRTFAEMGFSNWTLKFQNLADDFFTYTVATRNAKGLGATVPRDGQLIEIFYNGVRKFKGHVVKPRLGLKNLTVTAYGPFWWLGKITLTGLPVDKTGLRGERASYGFPTQNLRLSLQALINRAVDKGVPMAEIPDGELTARISAMFPMLQTTLSNMSFAAALAELMSLAADAVAWFDYAPTTPELHITRRGDMAATNYAVGATGSTRVESAEIFPRTDQQVRRVNLNYMKRQPSTGLPQWAAQTSDPGDTAITTQAHKRQIQIITVSGPETLAFAPKNDYDSVILQTKAAFGVKDLTRDPVFAGAFKQWKTPNWQLGITPPAGWFFLTFGEPAAWMRKDYGVKTKEFKVGGWINVAYGFGSYVFPGALENYLVNQGRLLIGEYDNNNASFKIYVSFTATLINLAYPKKTTVYKKWDHDFLAPPAGLAAALKETQDWLPWEGPVVIAQQELTGDNGLSNKLNLTNAHPDHAAMDALVKAVTYEGGRHRVTWDLGPPARTELGGLVNKLRRNPQDNIVWL